MSPAELSVIPGLTGNPCLRGHWLDRATWIPAFAGMTERKAGMTERKAGIGRALYCFQSGKRVIVVHAFVKKTRQTPDKELKLARKRMKEIEHG